MKIAFGIKTQALLVSILIFASFLGVSMYIGSTSLTEAKLSAYKVGQTILLKQNKEYYKNYTNSKKESLQMFLDSIEKDVESLRYHTSKIFKNAPYINAHAYWNSEKHLTHLANNQLTSKKDDISALWSPTWMKVDKEVIKKIELTAMLNEVFEPIMKRDPSIVASYFLANEGFIRYYPSFDILSAMPKDFIPLNGKSTKPVTPKMNPNRQLIWSALYGDTLGKGLMISAVAPVYNNDAFLGLVGVDMTLNDLVKHHIKQNKKKHVYSILLDKNFKPIALPSLAMKDIYNKELKEGDEIISESLLSFDSPFKKLFNSIQNEKSGFNKIILKNKTVYISYVKIDKFDWFYANVLEEKELMSATNTLTQKIDTIMNQSINKFIILSFVIFIILVISVFVFINLFLKPIIELSDVTKAIASGDLDKKIDIDAKNEIGVLVKNFEHMQRSILTHQKNLTKQIKFKNIVMETVNAPIYIKDELGRYIDCNQAFCDFFGKTKEELIGKTMSSLVKGKELEEQFDSDKRVFEKGGNLSKEFNIHNGNDEMRELIIYKNSYINNDNDVKYIVGTYFDLTDMNRAKKEIENFNIKLQTKVDEQTKELKTTIEDLKKMQNRLVQSEKMASLGGLVAGVAHEINTPVGISLTGITHFLDITTKMKKDYESDNISKQEFEKYIKTAQELATLINSNLEKTVRLVSSFKQVSVDQTNEQKREFYLKKYSEEILLSIKNITKKSNLDIEVMCDETLKINSYPGAYSQILTNLIINSIKHAYHEKEKGIISIEITKNNNTITLIYKDDGKGISKENLPKIFDPFFTTNRDSGGTGLGLNIIYNIITHTLNGSITCKSEQGHGVEFGITFCVEK